MPVINENTVNNKSLANASEGSTDTTWDDHTETWNENDSTWNSPGTPITKNSENSVNLSNSSENI